MILVDHVSADSSRFSRSNATLVSFFTGANYYAYPPLTLMTQKGVTPNWRRPPFPLNIKYSVPHSTQNIL